MKFHPDRNPDDSTAEAKFKEVKEAYEVLSDKQKRATYDQHGHAAFEHGGMGGGGFGGDPSGFGDVFGDVFGDIFGAGGRRGIGKPGCGRSQASRSLQSVEDFRARDRTCHARPGGRQADNQ